MGRVRTKTVKRAAKHLLEKHYHKLTSDFHINKKILSEVAKVPTKSLRNKIAGFATHLMKRIQRGPVKGISLKVQEEERQRRLDWVPKQSEIKIDKVDIDAQTSEMLKRRFGEEFYSRVQGNLTIKAAEQTVKKDFKGKARRTGGDHKERGPRQQKDKKEGAPKAQQEGATTEKPAEEDKPKRDQRRRGGPRQGQQQ